MRGIIPFNIDAFAHNGSLYCRVPMNNLYS